MRTARWITSGVLAAGTGLAAGALPLEGEGFSVPESARSWSRWQARVAVDTPASAARYRADSPDGAGLKWRRLSVVGDYYFSPSLAVRPSGFRATSGLLAGGRSSLSLSQSLVDGAGAAVPSRGGAAALDRSSAGLQTAGWPAASPDNPVDSSAVPYVGIGYTGASAGGGFSFSADLGVMAIGNNAAVKLGRSGIGAPQSLDDTLRDMRLSPVLQLGVSYSF